MSTIYTLNGKVLKNAANDKWLAKKEAPAGIVLNSSNAIDSWQSGYNGYIIWEGTDYPNTCDLAGKTLQIKITSSITPSTIGQQTGIFLMYGRDTTTSGVGGPNVVYTTETQPGTYTYECASNPAPAAGFGTYLSLGIGDINDADKIELTILD
jgi:hypothetical protein